MNDQGQFINELQEEIFKIRREEVTDIKNSLKDIRLALEEKVNNGDLQRQLMN